MANLLIINSPPPVGYSYCDPAGPGGNGSSCGAWNDTRTAIHNYEFLVNWFDAFPEYKERELYLSGESYAGIYIPTLAREIVRHQHEHPIKLAGFAMGDAVLGRGDVAGGSLFGIEFMHGHAQFSDKTYQQIMTLCHYHQLEGSMAIPEGSNCSQAQAAMSKEIGGYYMYNLYDDCWYQNDLMRVANEEKLRNFHTNINEQRYFGPPPLTGASANDGFATGRAHRSSGQDGFKGGLNDYPCGGPHALNVWVNATAVRAALHVTADAFFFSGDNGVGFPYRGDEGPLLPFYRELQAVASGAPGKVRVLIYSGDTDPCINTFWSQNWTSHVGFKETAPWRPWTLDGKQRMGGYVTRYANDFDFLTIRAHALHFPCCTLAHSTLISQSDTVVLLLLLTFLYNTDVFLWRRRIWSHGARVQTSGDARVAGKVAARRGVAAVRRSVKESKRPRTQQRA